MFIVATIISEITSFPALNGVIQMWNILPDSVIATNSINSFKNKLDKFWFNEEVIYNWKADLTS